MTGRLLPSLGRFAAVTMSYGMLSVVGVSFQLPPANIAAFWPAAGLAAGLLIRVGPRRRPMVAGAVFLGCLIGNLFDHPVGLSVSFSVANTFESILFAGGFLRLRRQESGPPLSVVADLGRMVVVAFASAGIAGVLGAALVARAFDAAFGDVWLGWTLGDGLGIVLLTPVIALATVAAAPRSCSDLLWWIGGLAALAAVVDLVFLAGSDSRAYLVIPVLAVIAVNRTAFETALASALVATAAVVATAHGRGPFWSAQGAAAHLVLDVQAFVACVGLSCLLLAIMAAGRRAALDRVVETSRLAQYLFDTVPGSMGVFDYRSQPPRCLLANAELSRILEVPETSLARGLAEPVILPLAVAGDYRGVVERDEPESVELGDGDGEARRWLHRVSLPLHDSSGRAWGVYVRVDDVTGAVTARQAAHERERMLAEVRHERALEGVASEFRLAQRYESVGRVATTIGRDLGLVLDSLRTGAGQARSFVAGEAGQEVLSALMREVDRGSRLLRPLLDLGQSGVSEPDTVDLVDLLTEVIELVGRRNGGNRIGLFTAGGGTAQRPVVLADRGQLEQAVVNVMLTTCDQLTDDVQVAVRTGVEAGRAYITVTRRTVEPVSGRGAFPGLGEPPPMPLLSWETGMAAARRWVEEVGGTWTVGTVAGGHRSVTLSLPGPVRMAAL